MTSEVLSERPPASGGGAPRATSAVLRRSGKRLATARGTFVDVRVAEGTPAVGYAVPKTVGGAVVRNRVRRRLRAIVREMPVPSATTVVAAKVSTRNAAFADLAADVHACFEELHERVGR